MKIFKKIKLFSKKPKYIQLMIKYNTLVSEYDKLVDATKSELYDKIFERIFTEYDKLEIYKNENIMLRQELKKLKSNK